jgi:predicted nuclease of predicted toxin-antitoxin system
MKILLDHCVDWRLKRMLPSHEVKSAADMGWEVLKNGKLLAAAAANSFQLMVAVDRHIKDQQNLSQLPIAVIVLLADSNRTTDLQRLIPVVERAMLSLKAGQLIEIDTTGNVREITLGR